MDLPVDSYFRRVLPRRKQNLPDFENISGQNKLANAAPPRKDISLVRALFRGLCYFQLALRGRRSGKAPPPAHAQSYFFCRFSKVLRKWYESAPISMMCASSVTR